MIRAHGVKSISCAVVLIGRNTRLARPSVSYDFLTQKQKETEIGANVS